ncbi:hypothetical protein [Undibacterium sp. Xuan67W]|uniref:hypothetical protein n=1 Tax=Undibacterium sp. Xuan67W TaxID=3413057 RepID=UPI003BF18CFB
MIQVDLPWMQQIGRPKTSQRLPVVLTVLEVQAIFAVLNASHPEFALFAKLLYGTGMRVMEAARLRTKDIIFEPRNGSWTSLSVHFFGFPARRDEAQPSRCNEEQRGWGAEKVCNQIRSVLTKTVMVKTLT